MQTAESVLLAQSGAETEKMQSLLRSNAHLRAAGVIRRNVDMAMMAEALREGGCIALSVLTEPYYFGGTCQDIARVKSAVSLPVLRKDFIIDERQIPESVALGADACSLLRSPEKQAAGFC